MRTTRADGEAWDFFPHDHARSRAYRWGEDGSGRRLRRRARGCASALALWNGVRPVPQGAGVRAGQRRGQPRRGRQGPLVAPRRGADELVVVVALPLPAGGVPLRRARSTQPRADGRRSASSSSSTPASSTTTATGSSRSTTPRPTSTTCACASGSATPGRRSRRSTCSPPVVPQHVVVGASRRPTSGR